jgi:hypothetical protein
MYLCKNASFAPQSGRNSCANNTWHIIKYYLGMQFVPITCLQQNNGIHSLHLVIFKNSINLRNWNFYIYISNTKIIYEVLRFEVRIQFNMNLLPLCLNNAILGSLDIVVTRIYKDLERYKFKLIKVKLGIGTLVSKWNFQGFSCQGMQKSISVNNVL